MGKYLLTNYKVLSLDLKNAPCFLAHAMEKTLAYIRNTIDRVTPNTMCSCYDELNPMNQIKPFLPKLISVRYFGHHNAKVSPILPP